MDQIRAKRIADAYARALFRALGQPNALQSSVEINVLPRSNHSKYFDIVARTVTGDEGHQLKREASIRISDMAIGEDVVKYFSQLIRTTI